MDIIVNFNLAYYDNRSKLVYDRRDISRNYMKFWFWIDLVSVFPFYIVALAIAGKMGAESTMSYQDPLNLLRLFKLARLVRLHRVFSFFSIVKYSRKISFVAYTLMRNFSVAVFWCHLWACIMFFIARQYNFDPDNTWIGSVNSDMSGFERYILSLYWSVVTVSGRGLRWRAIFNLYVLISFLWISVFHDRLRRLVTSQQHRADLLYYIPHVECRDNGLGDWFHNAPHCKKRPTD